MRFSELRAERLQIMELRARVLIAFLASQVKHISVHGIIRLFAAFLLANMDRRPVIYESDYQLRYGIYFRLNIRLPNRARDHASLYNMFLCHA